MRAGVLLGVLLLGLLVLLLVLLLVRVVRDGPFLRLLLRGVRELGELLLGLRDRRGGRQQGRFDARGGGRAGAVSASGTPYFARRSGIIDSTGALRRQLRPKRAWRRAW